MNLVYTEFQVSLTFRWDVFSITVRDKGRGDKTHITMMNLANKESFLWIFSDLDTCRYRDSFGVLEIGGFIVDRVWPLLENCW